MSAWQKRLNQLQEQWSYLTPEIVVEDASDPGSPLHTLFDWDDSSAAHKYRLVQARTLIRRVRITHNGETVQAYTRVEVQQAPKYLPTEQVAQNVDLCAQELARIHRTIALCKQQEQALLVMAQKDPEKSDWVARLNVSLQALATAQEALRSLH